MIKKGVNTMSRNLAIAVAWLSTAIAVSVSLRITGSAWSLWTFVLPAVAYCGARND